MDRDTDPRLIERLKRALAQILGGTHSDPVAVAIEPPGTQAVQEEPVAVIAKGDPSRFSPRPMGQQLLPEARSCSLDATMAELTSLSGLPDVAVPSLDGGIDGLTEPETQLREARLECRSFDHTPPALHGEAPTRAREPRPRVQSAAIEPKGAAAASVARSVGAMRASCSDAPGLASRLPLVRLPIRELQTKQRAAAYRAFVQHHGLQPRDVELIGVFGPVPRAVPERVAVGAAGNRLRLWYPSGVASCRGALVAVGRSRRDASLLVALLD